jgi:tRNA (guanine-N7-)-methyltransferase
VAITSLVRGSSYELEVGPGRGGFIQERAALRPDVGIVGLEVRRKWAAIVDAKLRANGAGDRARVFAEDAKDALPRVTPDASMSAVFVHFPDPWWKKRHRKRLVLEVPLLASVARLLLPGGELFIQTDVAERADEYEALVNADPCFETAGDAPSSARMAENPYGARSPRERRAIADGLPVYRLRWKRGLRSTVA